MIELTTFLEIVDSLHVARIANGGVFAEAQGVLASPAFKEFQHSLGILQTVIHFGEFDSKFKWNFTNLAEPSEDKTFPGLSLFWLSTHVKRNGISKLVAVVPFNDKDSVWELNEDLKQEKLHAIFVNNREKKKLAEFAELWRSDTELGVTGSLSGLEQLHSALIVSDAELSFFSALLTVAAIGDNLEIWLEGKMSSKCRLQHSVFEVQNDKSEEVIIGSNDYGSFYLQSGTFLEAMYELGLLCHDTTATQRLARLFRDVVDRVDSPLLATIDCASITEIFSVDEVGLKKFLRVLNRWRMTQTPQLGTANEVVQFCSKRFFLPGEYLLRSKESADRSYFALPLGYAVDEQTGSTTPNVKVGAFALGTLLNFPGLAEEEGLRSLRAIRTLLRTISAFGSDRQLSSLVKGRFAYLSKGPIDQLRDDLKAVIIDKKLIHESLWTELLNLIPSLTYFCVLADKTTRTDAELHSFNGIFFEDTESKSRRHITKNPITAACFKGFFEHLGFQLTGEIPDPLYIPGQPGMRFMISVGELLRELDNALDRSAASPITYSGTNSEHSLAITLKRASVNGISWGLAQLSKESGIVAAIRRLVICKVTIDDTTRNDKWINDNKWINDKQGTWDQKDEGVDRTGGNGKVLKPLVVVSFTETSLVISWPKR